MLLTYKIKHNRDFSDELAKARIVAEYVVYHGIKSLTEVKHIGLKSVISSQISRKYGNNKKIKKVKKVKLTIPGQAIKWNPLERKIVVSCLKLDLIIDRSVQFERINQVEVGPEYAFVSVTVAEAQLLPVHDYLGIDLNSTGHYAVVANPRTGKVWKFGKVIAHIRRKYTEIRRRLQRRKDYATLKRVGHRERNIVKNWNHQISRRIVDVAYDEGAGIRMEDLYGMRENKNREGFHRYKLDSWSFYQLQKMIEYKAKIKGVPVQYIQPFNTSRICSKCGRFGIRTAKKFVCELCGHVENADVNASFNIALRKPQSSRFGADRDVPKGRNDTPLVATVKTIPTRNPVANYAGVSLGERLSCLWK